MAEQRPKTSQSEESQQKTGSKKRPNRKERRQFKKEAPEGKGYPKTAGSNDFAWHTPDAELLERASTVPWSFQTGELVDVGNAGIPMYASQAGILVVRDQLAVGGAGYYTPTATMRTASLPTYQAANTLLSEMRSRARIRNTYDAPDVFMINMAMANIYAGVIFAKRLAGTARMFTYKNQYLPEALIKAQGFDPAWFKTNQYRFITELNIIISEVNKVYIPNRMHYFELINERFSNYYTEGDDIRDQLYVITPAFLNMFDTTGQGGVPQLKPCMCIPGKVLNAGTVGTGAVTQYDANNLYSGDDLLLMLRRMLENVISEPSTADITGDMANAFGESDRFYLPMADPMAIVTPVFNEEILEMIHNMSWSAAVVNEFHNFYNQASVETPVFKVIQDPNDNRIGSYDIFAYPTVRAAAIDAETAHRIIDVHKNPDPQKTFAITRMRNYTVQHTTDSADPTKMWVNVLFSSDIVCEVSFYYYTMDPNGQPALSISMVDMMVDPSNTTANVLLAGIEAFHYRPLRGYIEPTNLNRIATWVLGETDIWALCDYSMLKTGNTISLMSLLGAYNNMG